MLEGMYPAPGLAFIRHIETEERYPGSQIIVTPKTRDQIARCQFEVVSVGDYEKCSDEDCDRSHNKWGEHVHHLMQGDWVLVKNRSWQATPDPHIFVVRQDAILGKFEEG